MKPTIGPSKKTFQQNGKWVEHRKSPILTCRCGNKYIKTRLEQTVCIQCLYKKR